MPRNSCISAGDSSGILRRKVFTNPRAKLVAGDRDEVGLHLVQLLQSPQHLLPSRSQASGLGHERDLIREPAEHQQPFAVDGAARGRTFVQQADRFVAHAQGNDALRRVGVQNRAPRSRDLAERRVRCEACPTLISGVAVHTSRDEHG
jgi:hypothetical protein